MFKLVIQDDEGKTTVVPLIRDEITIGRKEGNTIRLTERNVSRRHARIVRSNGEVQIEDLGSYNGIRVNNARIAERVSLRVSDQVQIGDYKLYLKAEGVEQVDDARTMPIERVETAPTDVHAAVAPAPTAPMPAQTPPPQIVGNPNRTLVAIADTDPQGRPVASAAQVAALTTPMGYGKLVVLSSNFAGKEFELSRPQMIIGRTDENDIVINHRSISRNHAKLVREPETGRYTISDLQSSNGVRVNGQDYGKVELRRGDVIDLGHVRLRFIEPGEDFVFTRDAVITDVPEAGGRRNLLVAIVVALLVVGAGVVVFVATRGGGDKPTDGSDNAIKTGSQDGSNNPVVAQNPADAPLTQVEPPDAPTTAVTPKDDTDRTKMDCMQAKADKKWQDLENCSKKLAKLDAKAAKEYAETAVSEQRALIANGKVADLITADNLKAAKAQLDLIPEGSSYHQEAKQRYDAAEKQIKEKVLHTAGDYLAHKKCTELRQYVTQMQKSYGDGVGDDVRAVSNRCVPETAIAIDQTHKNPKDNPGSNPKDTKDTKDPKDPKDPNQGSGAVTVKNPPPACDVDQLRTKGTEFVNMGQYGAALTQFKKAMACPGGNNLAIVRLAFLAACQAGDAGSARTLFALIPPAQQNGVQQICMRNHIDPTSKP